MIEHRHRIPIALLIALFAVAFACVFWFCREYYIAQNEISRYAQIESAYTRILYNGPETHDISEQEPIPYISADFAAMRAMNPEVVGWINIPNTLISYPVMQCADNSKYLSHDSTGKKSSAGAAFLDYKNAVQPLDKNTVIYAHNMGNGRQNEMFGPLLDYKSREYYEDHRMIQFDTYLENHGWWEIFAVIQLDTYSSEFNYLRQVFRNEDEFRIWLDEARRLSLYDTDVPISDDDAILTLSTCDRSEYGRNGRFLVLAKHTSKKVL